MAKNTKAQKQKTSKNTLNKVEQFHLRMSLLRYWFVKNIFVFIWSLFIVCIGLTFSGLITAETPVLGVLFGDLSNEIKTIIDESGGNFTLYSILESLLSIAIVIGLCMKKLRALSFEDIKSPKCQILLVKAGLWFNEEGKLAKRAEVVTQKDLNKDGKIGEKKAAEIQKEETIVEGLKRAGEEFVTIVTLDLKNIKKDQTEEVYETTGLSEVKVGVDDIQTEVRNDTRKLFGLNEISEEEQKKKQNKIKTFFSDMKKALSITTKTEEEKKAEEAAKLKKKQQEEKEKEMKELAKKQAKAAEEAAKQAEKEKIEKEKAAEKARMKQVETKKVTLRKEDTKKVETTNVKPETKGNAQSQLSALLKNKR